MGPFHILLDQMGLDQMGLDQMGLDKEGIHPRKSLIFMAWTIIMTMKFV